MDKEKFYAEIKKLKSLTSDFSYVDTPEIKKLLEKMIVERARKVVEMADFTEVDEE